jgi:hypothetical protein
VENQTAKRSATLNTRVQNKHAFNKWFFVVFIGLLLLICMLATISSAGESEARGEYEIKASYLYKFLFFAKWPEDIQKDIFPMKNTITIGILGKDPFGNYFAEVEGKLIISGKKKLLIERYGAYKKGLNLKQCELLFISSSEIKNIDKIMVELKAHPVLTVADFEGFLTAGGMIKFVWQKKKIRWEINHAPIKVSGLSLSSMIFQSAVKVVNLPP